MPPSPIVLWVRSRTALVATAGVQFAKVVLKVTLTRVSAPASPASHRLRYTGVVLSVLALFALRLSEAPLRAQQRDPAIELYGLTGAYYFGSSAHLLKNREWRPQVAVGGLFPLGSKWAVLIDGNLSVLKVNEGLHGPYDDHPYSEFYRQNPGIPNEDFTTQRLIAILPSVVRLWRRERFSIYFGGGLGLEHQSQLIRYRPIDARPVTDGDGARGTRVRSWSNAVEANSTLVRAEKFIDFRDGVANYPLIVRGGVLANLAPHVVWRAGYSFILNYLDSPLSKSIEVGIGYRF